MSSTKIWFSRKKNNKRSNQYKTYEPINKTFDAIFKKGGKNEKRNDKTDK